MRPPTEVQALLQAALARPPLSLGGVVEGGGSHAERAVAPAAAGAVVAAFVAGVVSAVVGVVFVVVVVVRAVFAAAESEHRGYQFAHRCYFQRGEWVRGEPLEEAEVGHCCRCHLG